MSSRKSRSPRRKRRHARAVSVGTSPGSSSPGATLNHKLVSSAKRLFAWDDTRSWTEIRPQVIAGWLAVAPIIVWAFWPTMIELFQLWNSQPDYSHGFLVPPIAIYFLWARRERFPGWSSGVLWAGTLLILISLAIRWLGGHFFLYSLDGWALVVCLAGVVWTTCGTRVFRYCLPSILFLFFAVRLPGMAEKGLSLRLQGIATEISTWTLQLLGQPALAEGNTILLGDTTMEVEQACSGMRIFLGIFAIAFAYVVMAKRSWFETVMIAMAIIPIALIANSTRIVSTGLLYELVSGEAAKHFSHDLAGYVMIPLAAAMFFLLLRYLKLAYREIEIVDSRQIIAAKKS